MKNTLKSLLALVLLICTIFSITSCTMFVRPPRDLEEAAENLEDADYYAGYYDDADDISRPGAVEYLYADNDEDDYEKYEFICVIVFETKKAADLYYKEVKMDRDHQIESIKNDIEEFKHYIKQYEYYLKEFEDDMTKDEVETYEERIEKYQDNIEEYEEMLKKIKKEYVLGKSGKKVWYGTKEAFEDAKG